jgi:hypothetical protein
MTDDIKELLKNPALRLAEEIAAARLKRARVVLGEDWGLPTPKSRPEAGYTPEFLRKLGGD